MTQFTDDQLDAMLRASDVADQRLSAQQVARKDALLANLTTPGSGVVTLPAPRQRRYRALRWAVPVAAAAALAGVFVLDDGSPGGGKAFASWTPNPTPVSGPLLATAQKTCVEDLRGTLARLNGDVPQEQRATTDPATLRPVLAEQRGKYLLVMLAAPDGSTQDCFFNADKPTKVEGSGGGAASKDSKPPVTLTGHQLEVSDGGSFSGEGGPVATAQGRVGPQVRAVTVHSEGRTVQATLAGGRFGAWWPSSADFNTHPEVTYDLTLADGSVIKNAPNLASSHPAVAVGPREIGDVGQGGGAASDGGTVQTVSGRAGSEVASVTVHAGASTVTAQVRQGSFTAHWPGKVKGAQPKLTFDLTFTDGSVRAGVTPVG